MANDDQDPFVSIGGGVKVNGGWVPYWHESAQAQTQAQAPTPRPIVTPSENAAQPAAAPAQTPATAPAPAPAQAPAQTPAPAPAQAQPSIAQQTLTTTPVQGPPATVASAFQQALLRRLTAAPPTADSAEIAPALQANRLAEQRGQERNRALLAERAAKGGYDSSGAFDSQLMGLEEGRAAREAAYEADAIRGLGNRQAEELLAALALSGGMLGQNDALDLQRYGIDTSAGLQRSGQDLQRYGIDTSAGLQRGSQDLQRYGIDTSAGLERSGQDIQRHGIDQDAALRREGLGMQAGLGGRELDLRDRLGSGQLNLGLLSALLNDQQFGQQLGANLGMFGASLNQQALLSLLGGL